MTALRQRILLALGAPVVALGCPREPVLGAGTDASAPSPSSVAPSPSASSPTSVEEETGPVPDVGPTVVDAGAVDSGATDAAPAKKAAKVTYAQYKPKVAPPNYCPQTSTAQCMSLDDAVYQSTFPNVPSTKPKACPPQLPEPCPCHPAAPMGCTGGTGPTPQCSVALLADVTSAERKKSKTDVCCYETQQVCVPPWVGRALRLEARNIIAEVTPRDDWAKGAPGVRARADGLRSVRFLRAALGEHAAIASFSLTALALLAHGAPAELVADTHRAALDEVEHARLMFGLAGQGLGPGALALPSLRIPSAVELVTATFRDACVQETIGAVAVRAEAEEETDPTVRAALETIAADEERHAILAYRTLAWALSVSGEAGRVALRSELAALDSTASLIAELVVPCTEAALSAGALASLS